MNDDEIQKLRAESVKEIAEQLPALTPEELAAVLAAEQADATPRKTLVEAITAEQASRTKEPSEASGSPEPAAKESAAVSRPWLAPDYAGPLTADQAQARLAKFGQHVTKPATATATK
jgi:hypothetical protein